MILRILLIALSILAFNGCTKKAPKDHSRFVTLKLAPEVKVTLTEVSNSGSELVLRPQVTSPGNLTDIKVKVIQEVEDQEGFIISEEDFTRHNFTSESLKNINVKIADATINNKIVLIVSGKIDGQEFNLSSVHNSLFQKEIEDAKIRLQERSRRQ